MTMKTRGVAFNLDDPAQADLYTYTKNFKNFSAYVKGLIERDKAIRIPSGSPAPKKFISNEGSIKFTLD